jgi:hypothetical protein
MVGGKRIICITYIFTSHILAYGKIARRHGTAHFPLDHCTVASDRNRVIDQVRSFGLEDRSDNSSISDLGTTRLLLSSDDVTPPFRLTSLLLCSRGTQWSTGAECFCDSSACWWVHVSSGQAVCVTGETGAQRPVSRSARVPCACG